MEIQNSLLRRQLGKFFGPDYRPSPEWCDFLANVDKAYQQFDEDRKQLERSLDLTSQEMLTINSAEHKAKSQALAVLDAASDAAFAFTPNTYELLFVNQGALKQHGLDRDKMLTMTFPALVATHDRARVLEQLEYSRSNPSQPIIFTSHHISTDGREFPVETSLQFLQSPDFGQLQIAIVRDISERKSMERNILRSHRLEAIGNLASGIAHDMNNALAPIPMAVEMIKQNLPADRSGEMAEWLDLIHGGVKRSADMVRQVLSFARGVDGQRIPFDSHLIFLDIKKLLQSTFPKEIECSFVLQPNLPQIEADPTQLHQVLLNLCMNARDAMNGVGKLEIRARTVSVDKTFVSIQPDAKVGKYLLISVKDTGSGIPTEILDKVFDPFFTTKSAQQGTGLGLSIVLGIVKGHGGFLRVHSVQKKGTHFEIYLPTCVRKSGSSGDTTFVKSTYRGSGEKILLVDDEANVLRAAEFALKRMNFQVVTATNGADGVMKLAQLKDEISLVMTDVNMPQMDGLGLIQIIKSVMPEMPIVVTSGRFDQVTMDRLEQHQVKHFLSKPYTLREVAKVLERALPPKMALSEANCEVSI